MLAATIAFTPAGGAITAAAAAPVFTARQATLAAHENMTVSIGFEPGTFAAASVDPLSYLGPTAIVGLRPSGAVDVPVGFIVAGVAKYLVTSCWV
jgi:hypothetical protein